MKMKVLMVGMKDQPDSHQVVEFDSANLPQAEKFQKRWWYEKVLQDPRLLIPGAKTNDAVHLYEVLEVDHEEPLFSVGESYIRYEYGYPVTIRARVRHCGEMLYTVTIAYPIYGIPEDLYVFTEPNLITFLTTHANVEEFEQLVLAE